MLSSKEYVNKFKERSEKMVKIVEMKNNDYAGEKSEDAFRNFKVAEDLGVVLAEKGIMVRMLDKVTRIINLMDQEAKVKDESIISTLIDLANYAIILSIYLEDKYGNHEEDGNWEKSLKS